MAKIKKIIPDSLETASEGPMRNISIRMHESWFTMAEMIASDLSNKQGFTIYPSDIFREGIYQMWIKPRLTNAPATFLTEPKDFKK